MNRREYLAALTGGMIALAVEKPTAARDQPSGRRTMLLSRHGSGRATAYCEANKIVTFKHKTHVAWLDSVAEGFRVRIRTLDRRSNQWSPTFTIGAAFDNHGGPALTVDSRGFLHVVYYPHHHPFRYRRSKRPNDASEWEEEIRFGEKLTYPTLVCGPDDTLYLTARRSRENHPWFVERWTKSVGAEWRGPQAILRSTSRGYSHFQEALAWSPDQQTLHLSCRIHQDGGASETVAYMRSDDFGKTWRCRDGSIIELPAMAATMDVVAVGGRSKGQLSHKCGSIAVDPDGIPHILYSAGGNSTAEMLIAAPEGRDAWKRTRLAGHVARQWPGWRIGPAAAVVFDKQGTMFITATLSRENESDIVLLESRDAGQTFSLERPGISLPRDRKWWPNLERPTGHNVIAERPGVLFAAGIRGQGNKDVLSNDVYWVG